MWYQNSGRRDNYLPRRTTISQRQQKTNDGASSDVMKEEHVPAYE
jgi:hypothetical protein